MNRGVTTILSAAAFWMSTASPAGATVFELKFYKVDDTMRAFITNSAFNDAPVVTKTFGADYPYEDISSFIKLGANVLTLSLENGPAGYTYGYDFRVDGVTFDSGSCGSFNTFGCDNDRYQEGLVWTKSISFNLGQDGMVTPISELAAVPEPGTWAMLLIGFGFIGAVLRGRKRILAAEAT